MTEDEGERFLFNNISPSGEDMVGNWTRQKRICDKTEFHCKEKRARHLGVIWRRPLKRVCDWEIPKVKTSLTVLLLSAVAEHEDVLMPREVNYWHMWCILVTFRANPVWLFFCSFQEVKLFLGSSLVPFVDVERKLICIINTKLTLLFISWLPDNLIDLQTSPQDGSFYHFLLEFTWIGLLI